MILCIAKHTPTPDPSPKGGGGFAGVAAKSTSPLWGGVRGGGILTFKIEGSS